MSFVMFFLSFLTKILLIALCIPVYVKCVFEGRFSEISLFDLS